MERNIDEFYAIQCSIELKEKEQVNDDEMMRIIIEEKII